MYLLPIRLKLFVKMMAVAFAVAVFVDNVGVQRFNVGIGYVVILPMVLATIIGGGLGRDFLKVFSKEESKFGGKMVLIVLAPFMAKIGISAGGNLDQLVEFGPALFFQEFGNLATIIISMPVALALGLKRESVGACYSIGRDTSLGLTTDIFGPDSPEMKGTFAVYVVGSVIGALYMGLLAGIVASWDILHPLALGMASGVGSSSMMSAAAGTVASMYPEYSEQIIVLAGASGMLSTITSLYMSIFIAIPMTRKFYKILSGKSFYYSSKEVASND